MHSVRCGCKRPALHALPCAALSGEVRGKEGMGCYAEMSAGETCDRLVMERHRDL